MKALARVFFLVLAVLAIGAPARAQSAPQIDVEVDTDTVAVGDLLMVQMSATSADAMPSDPRLGSTPGFQVRTQNASPSQTHISINGNRMDRYTLTVMWGLEAQKVGLYTVGPPNVSVGGSRYAGKAIKVRVVPPGQAPQPQRQRRRPTQIFQSPFGFSPFDPWRGLIPDDMAPQTAPAPPTADPKLALDAPRGALYFLHATIDRPSVVVGEQVTFSVYEYLDAQASDRPVAADERDAQVPDFVKHPLLKDDQDGVFAGYASVGGRTWLVTLVRRWALFPLRTGDLSIEPLTETMDRPRAIGGQTRATEALTVHVTEPPAAGRPPGYTLGDVGRFALSATVNPREVEEGGAVGVHVEISGTGNLPSAVTPAAREGVEWLPPETHEEMGPVGHDVWGGKRSFDFVVRMKKSGPVDLGTLSLPFWDPDPRRYDVARAPLGTLQVKPNPGAQVAAEPEQPVLAGLPAQRDALEGDRAGRSYLDDRPLFWILGVGAWPVLFGVVAAGRAVGGRALRTWRTRRASPATDLKDRVARAHAACGGKDAREADAAIARALEAATVVHAGVNVRASVGGEVVDRLERAGVGRDAASQVADILRECEAARFSPDATDLVAARDRWVRAQGAIRGLEGSREKRA
jgi:hypothetical protein